MRLLGAILAGGMSSRFGSDKAMAMIDGRPMIDHVIARLSPQVDGLVVCGRKWAACPALDDWPHPDMGPLGGLAAALRHASAGGFDMVISTGCDLPDLPSGLYPLLEPGPAVIQGQPLIGLWPTSLAGRLGDHLKSTADLSMRHWIDQAGARRVRLDHEVSNINTPGDLDLFVKGGRAEG